MSSLAGSEGVLSDIWACLPVYTAGLDWTTLAGGGDSDIPRRAFPFPVSCLGGWGGTLGEGRAPQLLEAGGRGLAQLWACEGAAHPSAGATGAWRDSRPA